MKQHSKKGDPAESHSFNVNVAKVLGKIEKAILLKEIKGWCEYNNLNKRNTHQGFVFSFNSARAFNEKFPYMAASSLARWLDELEADGVIFSTDQFNERRADRTKWYTVNGDLYDYWVTAGQDEASPRPLRQEWLSRLQNAFPHLTISQNEKCIYQDEKRKTISQNEKTISQNGVTISQNERALPSLTTSLTTSHPPTVEQPLAATPEVVVINVGFEPFEQPADEVIYINEAKPEKEKKVAAKKEKATRPGNPDSLPFKMWEVWNNHHLRKFGVQATKDGKYFSHLKLLATKLAQKINERNGLDFNAKVPDNEIVGAFNIMLTKILLGTDLFYVQNFTPDIFNGRFLNIYQSISKKTGTNDNANSATNPDKWAIAWQRITSR